MVEVIAILCLIGFVTIFSILYYKAYKESVKTSKAKRDMYNKWYDLGVLIADIENEKLKDKEIK